MAQQVKPLDIKPHELSLIHRTHTVEEENQLPQLPPDINMHTVIFMYTHINS